MEDKKEPKGFRINYNEVNFEDGPAKHSRFITGTVQVNKLNRDYINEMRGNDKDAIAYITLMIEKETIVYNDKTGSTDQYLEKFLIPSFV